MGSFRSFRMPTMFVTMGSISMIGVSMVGILSEGQAKEVTGMDPQLFLYSVSNPPGTTIVPCGA